MKSLYRGWRKEKGGKRWSHYGMGKREDVTWECKRGWCDFLGYL